jgi:hypothetical protein
VWFEKAGRAEALPAFLAGGLGEKLSESRFLTDASSLREEVFQNI